MALWTRYEHQLRQNNWPPGEQAHRTYKSLLGGGAAQTHPLRPDTVAAPASAIGHCRSSSRTSTTTPHWPITRPSDIVCTEPEPESAAEGSSLAIEVRGEGFPSRRSASLSSSALGRTI